MKTPRLTLTLTLEDLEHMGSFRKECADLFGLSEDVPEVHVEWSPLAQVWLSRDCTFVAALRETGLVPTVNLPHVDLRGIDLRGADLRGAHLWCGDLRGADLRGARLRYANLQHASLRETDLRDADFRGTDLCNADVCGALVTADQILGGRS